MRPTPIAAAAVLSAATLMIPVAPALAAGHGPGSHGHAGAHAHTPASHDPLARQLRGTEHVVANQVRQVTRLADFVSATDKISDTDRPAVTTAVQADLDALTTLQGQLADAATHHDLVQDVHRGILIRAVARTQATVAVQAGAVRDFAAASTDSTAAGTATSDADAAVTAVVELSPDSTRTEIHEARQSAEAALDDADTALGATSAPDA